MIRIQLCGTLRIERDGVPRPAPRGAKAWGLLAYLLLSVVASLAAGVATAKLAPRLPMRHVWILAALLLATGIPVQMTSWELLPAWYHLMFLAALVPVTVLGGR